MPVGRPGRWVVAVGLLVGLATVVAAASAGAGVRGGLVVFAARPSRSQVFLVAADGSAVRQLSATLGGDRAAFAAVAPDGQTVAYSTVSGALRSAGTDGAAVDRPLDPAGVARPVWSADGTWVAYQGSSRAAVWVAHADGTGAHEIGPGANPSWSPDSRSIVVGSGHELVVYDLASAAARVVTSVTYNVVAPSFSPDGHEIAFTETNPADQTADKVRLVGTDGSAGRPLGAGWLAAWSPIGDRLAVLRRFYGPSPIDIVRPDGSNLARVADDASLAMSWSPDGRSLAYTTSASPNALTVVAADGSKKRTVITAQPNGGVSDVSWAPDGTKLLVVMDVPPPAGLADTLTQLFALDPGSLALRQLTRVSAYHSAPAWAADGHTLAFVTRTGFAAGPRVAVSNPDGSLPRTVTRGDQPSLSPDGSRLLVVRNNRIWVVQLPGGRARQLHPGTFPAWSPDGKLIAYLSRRSLWTIRADGRRPHQLLTTTATRRLVGPPVWYGSPERLYIATNSGAITLAADGNDPQPVDLSRASDGSSFDITATSTPSPDGTGVLVERYHDGIARLILLPDTSSLPPTALLTASYALQGTLAWQPTR